MVWGRWRDLGRSCGFEVAGFGALGAWGVRVYRVAGLRTSSSAGPNTSVCLRLWSVPSLGFSYGEAS